MFNLDCYVWCTLAFTIAQCCATNFYDLLLCIGGGTRGLGIVHHGGAGTAVTAVTAMTAVIAVMAMVSGSGEREWEWEKR